MTPGEYIPSLVAKVSSDIAVAHTRFREISSASGPAVLWRVGDKAQFSTIDPGRSGQVLVVLECRSPTVAGAHRISDDLIAQAISDGRLIRIIEEYDAVDDESQERGNYFVSILSLELVFQ